MQTEFWTPIRLSVEIAIVAGFVVIILGTLLGKWMAKRQFRGKMLMETILLLPLVLPPTVVGFLLIILFGKQSVLGQAILAIFDAPLMFTWWAAVIAAIIVAFPLMYQSAKAGFEAIDEEIEHAARVDGAKEWQVLLFISVPLALKMLVAGGILSVTRALGEFGATLMFAGNIPGKTQTTPLAIYTAMDSGNMTVAWLWVSVMVALSFLMLLVVHVVKER